MKKAKIGKQKWEDNGGEEGRRMGCGEQEDRK
jgi:hypothetical protein